MKTRSLIAVLLTTATSVVSAATAANTLCAHEETVVFQCRTKQELISLCARAGERNAFGETQLRVGLPRSTPRLVAPAAPADFDRLVAAERSDVLAKGANYLYVELSLGTQGSPLLQWTEAGFESSNEAANLRFGVGRERTTLTCTPGTVEFRGLDEVLTRAK